MKSLKEISEVEDFQDSSCYDEGTLVSSMPLSYAVTQVLNNPFNINETEGEVTPRYGELPRKYLIKDTDANKLKTEKRRLAIGNLNNMDEIYFDFPDSKDDTTNDSEKPGDIVPKLFQIRPYQTKLNED